MGAKFLKLLMCSLVLVLMTGCSSNRQEPWLTIGDVPVYEDEVMLYLYQTYNDFEEYGGKDVWLIEDFSGGKSAGDVAKQGAIDNLIKSKVMVQQASGIGIEADEATLLTLEREAMLYFEALPSAFVTSYNITLDSVKNIFLENYYSEEVTLRTTSNYDLKPIEIQTYIKKNQDYARLSLMRAEDILTTYRVQHLVLRTHERGKDSVWQPLSEEQQVEAEIKINALYQEILEGAAFMEVVIRASQTDYFINEPGGMILSKAQLPEDYESALNQIEEGQVTQVIQGDYGYNVFYLEEKIVPNEEAISNYEQRFREWELALRKEAEIALTREAFEVIYERWRAATTITYTQQWTELSFIETIKNFMETGSEE